MIPLNPVVGNQMATGNRCKQDCIQVTVEARYFVCANGQPVGGMYDTFESGMLRQLYPFRRSQNRFTNQQEAEVKADEFREYIREIERLDPKQKVNMSPWRLCQ